MKYKILFVGDLNEYGRSFQRFKALLRLGHEVVCVSTVPLGQVPGISPKLSLNERIRHKLGRHLDKTGINKNLFKKVEDFQPNILWIEKVLCLKATVLKSIRQKFPELKVIHCCEDDMFAKHNSSVYFKNALSCYDFIFTTKSYNCHDDELVSLGAKRVELFKNCYDPQLHKPVDAEEEYKCDVSFVGTFEEERAQDCLFLAKNGIGVKVWGNGWNSYKSIHENLKVEGRPLYSCEFVKALCSSKVNLCFLRKINRDLQTSRSVEIPACGALMLAERTSEHLELFKEGEEASFFETKNELLEKVRFYLGNEEQRKGVAEKGRERCLKSGYSHDEELNRMLGKL
jgi:spore maturation protein CgeB